MLDYLQGPLEQVEHYLVLEQVQEYLQQVLELVPELELVQVVPVQVVEPLEHLQEYFQD